VADFTLEGARGFLHVHGDCPAATCASERCRMEMAPLTFGIFKALS
jgi:hypothetical protein